MVAVRAAPVKFTDVSATSSANLVAGEAFDRPGSANAHVARLRNPKAAAAPPSAMPCTKWRRAGFSIPRANLGNALDDMIDSTLPVQDAKNPHTADQT
jgi:hypothetical protein